MTESLTYGEWIKAKRAQRASVEEKEFLENRVRRLREEQKSMEAQIANTLEKISTIEDARSIASQRKTARQARKSELENEIAQRHEIVAAQRSHHLTAVAQMQDRIRENKLAARQSVLSSSESQRRSLSARRSDEVAKLAHRREMIKIMEREGLEQRRQYMTARRQKLQEAHARQGTRITDERDEAVKASADLLVVEADILRGLVSLRHDSRKAASKLAELVTGKQVHRPTDEDPEEGHGDAETR